MSRIKVTYVAMHADDCKPITTAHSMQDLRAALDDYYAVGKTDAECLGFTPYDSKYPDEYEGYYTYTYQEVNVAVRTIETDRVKVYCVELFPLTKEETV